MNCIRVHDFFCLGRRGAEWWIKEWWILAWKMITFFVTLKIEKRMNEEVASAK